MEETKANGRALIRISKLACVIILSGTLTGCLPDPWGWKGHASGAPIARNNVPTFTSAASVSVPEGAPNNVYTATAVDADPDTLSFSLAGGTDQAAFDIDSATGALSFTSPPDFEWPEDTNRNNDYAVKLRVDDGNGAAAYLDVMVTIVNRNEAPVFTSARSKSILENTTASYTASAFDPDLDAIDFSIFGGADQAAFNIDPVSGRLNFNSPPDFEAPADSNVDNVYVVELGADDGNGAVSTMTFTIGVMDANQLEVQVSFPTPYSNLGSVTETIVTGNLIDIEDGVVNFDDVSFIDVNGLAAMQALDDPSRWSVLIPAAAPNDTLMVLVNSVGGGLDTASLPIENNALILRPDLISIDIDNNRVLVGDSGGLGAMVAVDLTNGARTIVEDANTGTGPQIILPESSVLDANNNRLLIVDSYLNALVSLDLANGDRTIISDASTGFGPMFGWPLSIALDAANNRAFVVDADLEALLAVDLTNGDRTVISDAGLGSGPAFSFPTVAVFDSVNNRVLVADAVLEALIAVNPMNGNRSVVADASTGAGLNLPLSMVLDTAADRVLVGDAYEEAILSIDLSDGTGTVLSDAVTGSGPMLSFPNAMELDANRNRILVVDLDLDEVLTVDLSSGDRAKFEEADSGIGDGPGLIDATAVALHVDSNRALVTAQNEDGAGLVWVDLTSTNRAALSDANTGTGPDLEEPTGMVLDVANNRALVLDYDLEALLSVDLTNGDRTIISDQNTGLGTPFIGPMSVSLDGAGNRALIVDYYLGALISTDLANGNRTVVSDASTGSGPLIASPTSVALDEDNNRALVLDYDLNALVAVDLDTGTRTVISDSNTGSGPEFYEPLSVALDPDNNRALVSDGRFTSTLYWVDLASGDRSAITADDTPGVMLLDVSSVAIDFANSLAFATDAEVDGLVVVELTTGQVALASK